MKTSGNLRSFLILITLGCLNIISATINFNNENARFILKDNKSKIILKPSTVYGWHDSSIVNKVSGIGLGDYNLKQYDYNLDNILTYSEVTNSMQYTNWDIADNTIVHIKDNLLKDGYGGTINLGENSQLFIDDNVTLTLRNVVVKNNKNFVGNPAIKLASNRSKLALDNTTLNIIGDFYFDRGQLFAYNDVNFSGTNAFIYRSTVPSYITSGANLKFGQNTTFDFRPSTTGTTEFLAKDLVIMNDANSKLIINGATLKATTTGIRLTKGQLTFDNQTSLTSNAKLDITGFYNGGNAITSINFGNQIHASSWSSDGRYVVVGGSSSLMQLYKFTGTSLSLVTQLTLPGGDSVLFGMEWSPDGRYLVIGTAPSYKASIYKFNGSSLSLVVQTSSYGNPLYQTIWSPDGKYIALAGGSNVIQVYQFTGSSVSLVAQSASYGNLINGISWSPDGKYIAAGGIQGSGTVNVYQFTGSSLSFVTQSASTADSQFKAVSWSPDGKYLAAAGYAGYVYVYNFTETRLVRIATSPYYGTLYTISWSHDGKCIFSGGSNTVNISQLSGSSLTLLAQSASMTGGFLTASLKPDGNYIAAGGFTTYTFNIYSIRYATSPSQAISNSIVFGNSLAGTSSDLNVKLLSGANVSVDGIVNYDNTLGGTIFSNDDARFILKNSNSKIRMNPNTFVGWRDRSLIKNITGGGLGDYNLRTYSGADNIVTYAEAPGELVYDNSNAIIKLDR
ncbi:MAG: Serine/threonine protein kinase, partial [candidate division TM6 bacterium GW2011_GWF2_36_6]